jgi:hypothetical protein
MMNRIRSLGVAVVALAAPVLLAAPAAADTVRGGLAKVETRIGDDTKLTLAIRSDDYEDHRRSGYGHGDDGYRGGRGYDRYNEWGQTEREARELRRDALRACRQAIRYEAESRGYFDIDLLDEPRAYQVGRRSFTVTLDHVVLESRYRDRAARLTCEVRRGEVVSVDGFPHRRHRGGYDRRY